MALVVSIASEEPLCIKATAEAAAAWGRVEKGYGFSERGAIEFPGGRSLEITLNVAARPSAASAEFAKFPSNLESSGHLTDDAAQVGVFAVKRGKATVAIMVPALQGELETNLDEAIDLDRVVLATGTGAHLRMIVSIKLRPAAEVKPSTVKVDAPLLVQADIGVAVHGTSHSAGPDVGDGRSAEAFIEETTTSIVFARGAVVRLAEVVTPGQILILRHLATGEEVACRVVSVKANATVKGFVELEFLQLAPGFWGTALPGESGGKSGGVPAIAKAAPVAAARQVFSKLTDVPSAIGEVLLGERRKTDDAEIRPTPPAAVAAKHVAAPSVLEPAAAEVAPIAAAGAPIAAEAEPPVAEPMPIEAAAAPVTEAPALAAPDVTRAALPGAIEQSPAQHVPPRFEAQPEAVVAAASASAPLPPAEVQPPLLAEPAAISTEHAAPVVRAAPAAARAEANPAPNTRPRIEAGVAAPGAEILSGDARFAWDRQKGRKKSRAGVVGLAATILLAVAAGGGFYRWQQEAKQHANAAGATQPLVAAATPAVAAAPGAMLSSSAPLSGAAGALGGAPAAGVGSLPEPTANHANAANAGGASSGASAKTPAARPANLARPAAAAPPPAVRGPGVAGTTLRAPTAASRSTYTATPAITPALPGSAAGASAGGIFADAPPSAPSAPATPPPARTSSRVQQPRLLSAPSPVYPDAARAAHVQGDVAVDLLINELGKVAGLTILSGPPMLQDAAFDALRRRKYAPAMLDGKPVSTHVVVVIHFQL
jgi:TonB family protein